MLDQAKKSAPDLDQYLGQYPDLDPDLPQNPDLHPNQGSAQNLAYWFMEVEIFI